MKIEEYKKRFEDGEDATRLMTEIERQFKIPMMPDQKFNQANSELMNLYLKISESRRL